MKPPVPHISVCICTYRRPEWLRRLLQEILQQETGGLFTHSVVVADNDPEETGRTVVASCRPPPFLKIVYCVESNRNIAMARNRALAESHGDFIAFIDDDELPPTDWLLTMFKLCATSTVAGVLGPVLPRFEEEPPPWLLAGAFYVRRRYKTGYRLKWWECRTGNALLSRNALKNLTFRPEFGSGGEDQDFFRRALEQGHNFIWCDEASVEEIVPPARWSRRFLVSRAFLRGKNSVRHSSRQLFNVGKSLLAVPAYSLALPFLFLSGHHRFMKYLVKLADHTGRLLAAVRLNPMNERPMG